MRVTLLQHFDDVAMSHFSYVPKNDFLEFKQEVKDNKAVLLRLENCGKKATMGIVFTSKRLIVNWLGGEFVFMCDKIASLLKTIAVKYKKLGITFSVFNKRFEKVYKRHGAKKVYDFMYLEV